MKRSDSLRDIEEEQAHAYEVAQRIRAHAHLVGARGRHDHLPAQQQPGNGQKHGGCATPQAARVGRTRCHTRAVSRAPRGSTKMPFSLLNRASSQKQGHGDQARAQSFVGESRSEATQKRRERDENSTTIELCTAVAHTAGIRCAAWTP